MAMALCMQFDLKTTAVFLRTECILNSTVKEKRQTYVVLLDLVLKKQEVYHLNSHQQGVEIMN